MTDLTKLNAWCAAWSDSIPERAIAELHDKVIPSLRKAPHADVSERERALEAMLKKLHDADVLGDLDESMWTDARELLLNGSGTSPER